MTIYAQEKGGLYIKQIKKVPKVTIKREELDTSICIDPLTKTATVWSTIPTTVKRLYKLAEEYDDVSIDLDNEFGLGIVVPMNWVKVRPPRKISDEQKAAMAERMKKARKREQEETV